MTDSLRSKAALGFLLVLPGLAWAHASSGEAGGLLRGMLHPLGGLDHLLAMVAVGVWAAQCRGRAVWVLPVAFLAMMAAGGFLGTPGAPGGFAEAGVALSVVVLGLLVARAVRLPSTAGAAIVAVFAVFHGLAHGAEMPADVSGWAYGAGFLVATAFLHAVGIALALLVRRVLQWKAAGRMS